MEARTPVPEPRVLMFVPQYPYPIVGGLEKQSHELGKALQQLGVDVQVLSGKISADQPHFEQVEGIPVRRLRWSKWKPWRFLRSPPDVFLAMWSRRQSYDVIHVHQHSWIGLFAIACGKLLSKSVLTKLPNVGDYGIPGMRSKFLGAFRVRIFRRSDGVVAMTEQSIQELNEIGYPRERILSVSNGITVGPPCIADNHPSASSRCSVVFVGRLSEEKRLDSLLVAWQLVTAAVGSEARLEIWGEGPERSHLEGLCEILKIRYSVDFVGHVSNVRERLRQADVFVLPSRVEGNSNAVLEAMDAGLPVVATRAGGTPMQVGAEGAPLLFDVGDSHALANHLCSLIREPKLRKHYGSAMRLRVEQVFDMAKIAQIYRTAYVRLAANDSKGLVGTGSVS